MKPRKGAIMLELNQLIEDSLGAISQPVYTYALVRKEFQQAKDKLGVRITFNTFLKDTGLENKIFRQGKSGGPRVMLKEDVHQAFSDLVKLRRSTMNRTAYKKPTSAVKQAKGRLLGYARIYATKVGGTGKDRNKLKHKLDSTQVWSSVASGLKKDKRMEELQNLEDLMTSAGLKIPAGASAK